MHKCCAVYTFIIIYMDMDLYGFMGYDMNLYCSGDIVNYIVLLDIYNCVFVANAENK